MFCVLFGVEEIEDRQELIKSLELSEQTKDVVELINKLKNIKTDRYEINFVIYFTTNL